MITLAGIAFSIFGIWRILTIFLIWADTNSTMSESQVTSLGISILITIIGALITVSNTIKQE